MRTAYIDTIIRLIISLFFATLLFMTLPAAKRIFNSVTYTKKENLPILIMQVSEIIPEKKFKRINRDLSSIISTSSSIPTLFSVPIPVFKPNLSAIKTTSKGVTAPRLFSEDEVDKPARILSKVSPVYPSIARRSGLTGSVTVFITIRADGSVQDAKIVRSSSDLFEKNVIATLKKWQFIPAEIAGNCVAQRAQLTIDFNLD